MLREKLAALEKELEASINHLRDIEARFCTEIGTSPYNSAIAEYNAISRWMLDRANASSPALKFLAKNPQYARLGELFKARAVASDTVLEVERKVMAFRIVIKELDDAVSN